MRINLTARIVFLVLAFSLAHEKLASQLAPYVIFSGPGPNPDGTATGTGTSLIGSSITINGVSPNGFKGAVGGVKLVQSTGSAVLKSHIYSWDKVIITNKNTIEGNIAAGNSSGSTGTVVSIGSNVNLTGNIDSRGNIVYAGGTFIGSVNVSPGTYDPTGPTPISIGNSPVIPPQPSLPTPTPLGGYPDLPTTSPFYNITGNFSQGPGNYGSVNFSGNKTLTLNGPGIYVFKSILMTGNTNKIVFDFQGNSTGKFYVYIKQNADLGKMDASTIGGSAAKIWIEVQGDGLGTSVANSSFIIANGSGGGSKIQSTIYATRAGITIGSGTGSGSTSLYGALYSKTAVNIQSGVTLNYVPFDDCTPIAANAGPDQTGASTCGLTTVTLAGNNPSPGTGQWSIVSGTGGSFGNASSPTSTFSGIAGNAYTLRWTITNSTCASGGDNVDIKFNKLPSLVDADPGNKLKIPLDFTGHASLTGAISTDVTSFIWTTSDGVFSSATPPPAPPNTSNTLNTNVASGGIYTLTGTNAVGCTKSDAIEVTSRRGGVIGSELKSIYNNYPGSFDPNDPFFTFQLHQNDPTRYVTIDIIFFKVPGEDPLVTRQRIIDLLDDIPNYTDNLPDYGLTNIIPNGISKFTITGDFPILNLPNLDALVDILNYSRPYYRPFNNGASSTDVVDFASEGDITMRSDLVRKGYSQHGIELNGRDVKIGIISDSYGKITVPTEPPDLYSYPEPADRDAGRLPNYLPGDPHISDYAFNITKTDEGRAMTEIGYRVAKGAEIFFSTGVYTPGHFAQTILDLAQNKHCKVIVDDVTYPTESFLKDGIVATNVNKVVTENKVLYFTAAGNFRNNAYESDYHGTTSDKFPGIGVHDFGGDIFQKVRLKPGSYMFVLQWVDNFYSNEEIEGTRYDIDFFLSRTKDGKGLIGYNRINTGDLTRAGGDPIEFIPINIPDIGPGGPDSSQYDYYVIITNNTSTTDGPKSLKYIVYKNDIRFRESFPGQYASTISGQGNAAGAITIGAAAYFRVPGHPLLDVPNITKPLIERFSSTGGTIVNNEANKRLKPDLVGPDGVTVTVKLGPDYPVVDNYPNFYGTSAAAPHVAAGVALILQGLNKFKGLNIQDIEPAEMKKLIQKTAVNMRPDEYPYNFENPPDPSHYDFVSGAGLVNIDAAMRTFASPEPFEIRLVRPTNLIPCQDPFTLTIVGENFSANSVVYLDTNRVEPIEPDSSIKIPYTYISKNRDTIKVNINTCIANPYIWVFTDKTVGLIVADGGLSNGIRLFDKEIVVQTKPVIRKYGQDNPLPSTALITATLIDNGIPTEIPASDLATYGLDNANLKVNTTATRYSDVNTLDYTIYRTFSYPADAALTDKYRYTFKKGSIIIQKLPLKVIPLVNNSTNATVYEGAYIGPVTFDYQFWKEQPAEPVVLKDVAKKFHEAFLPGNALAVVKNFKKIQADGTVLSDDDLEKMSMMTTFKALKNSRKFKVVNNKLVTETDPNSFISQYLVDLASESIFDYTNNPKQAYFYEGYPGISKKALLSKTALENYEGQVHPLLSGGGSSPTLVSLLNGSASATLAPLFNGSSTLAPLFNGNQISIIDGKLATLNSAGKLVAIPNSPSILYVNGTGGVGSLAYIINGATSPTLAPLFNGAKIEMLDKSTLTLTNTNSYIKFENNDSAGLYVGGLQSINNAISGTLAFILNGSQPAPLPNYKELQNSNGTLVNGSNTLAPLFNGSFVALNGGTSGVGGLATLLNGGGVGGLAPLFNGASATLAPLFNGNSTLASLLNGGGFNTLASIINNVNLLFTNGATSATLAPLFNNSGGGGITITDNNAVIVDETDVDQNNANYLGALFGVNMITGLELGPQTVVPGTLINPNFDITYVNSHVNIVVDPSCLHTHSTAKNFSSTPTPQTATTLWINVTTKVSGQLNAPGKYILFHNGTFELTNIDYVPITGGDLTIPDGIIIAKDSSVSQFTPFTDWDGSKWITTVPVNFASSSDLFITGKILSSSQGFVKRNNNATTAIKAYFYTNAIFSDQWTYAMAAYRPYFNYSDIDEPNDVVAINLTGNGKAAGTPMPIITNNNWSLVPGGSGGGGNNYTGSTLSWAKLNPCPTVNSITTSRASSTIITMMESESNPNKSSSFNLYPNPAANRVNISFVPEVTGNSRIILYTMDGKKAIEINNGMTEAGKSYLRTVDVGKLSRGVYLVQLWNGNKISVGKVVINR